MNVHTHTHTLINAHAQTHTHTRRAARRLQRVLALLRVCIDLYKYASTYMDTYTKI